MQNGTSEQAGMQLYLCQGRQSLSIPPSGFLTLWFRASAMPSRALSTWPGYALGGISPGQFQGGIHPSCHLPAPQSPG